MDVTFIYSEKEHFYGGSYTKKHPNFANFPFRNDFSFSSLVVHKKTKILTYWRKVLSYCQIVFV